MGGGGGVAQVLQRPNWSEKMNEINPGERVGWRQESQARRGFKAKISEKEHFGIKQ